MKRIVSQNYGGGRSVRWHLQLAKLQVSHLLITPHTHLLRTMSKMFKWVTIAVGDCRPGDSSNWQIDFHDIVTEHLEDVLYLREDRF